MAISNNDTRRPPPQVGLRTLFACVTAMSIMAAACTGAFGSRIQTAIPIAVVGSAYIAVFFFVVLLCVVPLSVAFNFLAACRQALMDLVLLPPRNGEVQRSRARNPELPETIRREFQDM